MLRAFRQFKKYVKPFFGMGLLLVIFFNIELEEIITNARNVNLIWLAPSLVALFFSSYLSALRWRKIASIYGVDISIDYAVRAYAQGISTSAVVPGGILGGDAWRVMSLKQLNVDNKTAITTVLADRLSGVWILATISAIAGIFSTLLTLWTDEKALYWITSYQFLLGLLALAPILAGVFAKELFNVLLKSSTLSLGVQLSVLVAFGLCIRAVTPDFSWVLLFCVSAGIFIMATLPLSIGGFGPRELGAVFFLTGAGLSVEEGFLASLIYGMLCTVQGLLLTYYWIRRSNKAG
jgi:uncharacterized membrane protein YbhN (UPF0104 family)